jgi:hypothetical protein
VRIKNQAEFRLFFLKHRKKRVDNPKRRRAEKLDSVFAARFSFDFYRTHSLFIKIRLTPMLSFGQTLPPPFDIYPDSIAINENVGSR